MLTIIYDSDASVTTEFEIRKMSEYVKSQKGNEMLIFEGYRYRKDKTNIASKTWRCAKSTCRGRALTKSETHKVTKEHNHGPCVEEREALVIKQNIKDMAKTSDERPRSIIQQCSQEVSSEGAVLIQNYNAARMMIHRERKKMFQNGVTSATNIQEIEIPEEFKKTFRGDTFLLYDSGNDDQNRMIIFGTFNNLALLHEFGDWCVDGTFKVAPNLFYQVYTIHCLIDSKAVPMIYALLCNKTKDSYVRLFTKIKELGKNFTLIPSSILTDFEQAAHRAIEKVFPRAEVVGCFFHLSQNLWRKIQKTPGLVAKYKEQDEIRKHCKFLLALAFVPVRDVPFAFEILKEDGFPAEMETIVNYWESTYIGKRIEGIRPIFSISVWNMYERLQSHLPRTNNSLEAWHNAFQQTVDCHHPSMARFLTKLKQEQASNEIYITRFRTGFRSPIYANSKYYHLNQRLITISKKYSLTSIKSYLCFVANNLSL